MNPEFLVDSQVLLGAFAWADTVTVCFLWSLVLLRIVIK